MIGTHSVMVYPADLATPPTPAVRQQQRQVPAPLALTYSAEVLADTPAAYWRLGEASGTAMNDSSGNARHGTYLNTPGLGAPGLLVGDANTAVNFDGVNEQGTSPGYAAWMDPAAFTVEALIKPDTVAGNRQIVGRMNGVNPGDGRWQFLIMAGKLVARISNTSSVFQTCTSVATLVAGTTYHVAMTFSGTVIQVYINGVLDNSFTITGTIRSAPIQMRIGSYDGTGIGYPFDGVIDEVAFYPAVLSAARIAAHYSTGSLAAPGVPTNVAETHDDETISLTWDPPATGGAPTSYEVRIGAGTPVSTALVEFYIFAGLTPETAYTVEVRAVNSAGASAWVPLTVTTDAAPVVGLDVTCLVDEVSIQHGRGGATDQPEPSSVTLDVTIGPGAPLPSEVEIGAWLVITTTVGGLSYVRFTGRVTDIAIGWDDAGPNTPEAGVGQIIAVSPLADYARRVVGDVPFPQELDGARVARVFALAGLTLDPGTSDPGTVEVIPRDVDTRAALEVAQDTATSAGGLIWETREGDIRYADSEHRRNAEVDLDLDACDILVSPTWSRSLAGLVNEITIGYGVAPEDPAEGESSEEPSWHAVNAESQARYGRYDYSVTTELAREVDASAFASLVLTQNGWPVWMLNALPVSVADLTLAQTQTLLGLDVHALLRVTGLPATGATPTVIAAWVEGWTERLAWGVHDIELTVSDYCRTAPPPRWNDLDPVTTWDGYGSGTWDGAACEGMPELDRGRWDDVPATTRWDMVDAGLDWDEASP